MSATEFDETLGVPSGADVCGRSATLPGVAAYAGDVGVCVTRSSYDVNGNLSVVVPPSNTGDDSRRLEYTWTDDNLLLSIDAPDPSGSGRVTAEKRIYDGPGRTLAVTDALGHTSTMAYTADGLVRETNGQTYEVGGVTITERTTYGYNANGDQITIVAPRGYAVGATAAHHTTTTTWSG